MTTVTMRQLLEAGVHFGHQTRYWNPKMDPYIYGSRQRIHIINLQHTLPMFNDALGFLGSVAKNKGKILFVGTKYAARSVIKEEAIRCGMPYVDYRWLGGMLTNYKTIRQSIRRLKDLEAMFESEKALEGLTKKEMLNLMREKEKLSACLEGIKNMGGLPDALFIIDVGHEKIAVQEAKRLGIPVVGIVDTNTSPADINYMVPGNDDAVRAIRLYCKTIADVVIEARGAAALEKGEAEDEAPKAKVKKVIKKKKAASSAEDGEAVAAPKKAEKAEAAEKVKEKVEQNVESDEKKEAEVQASEESVKSENKG